MDRVVALDLHAGAIAGFFDLPFDHVHASAVALPYIAAKAVPRGELVVVSPDIGGVARARVFASRLDDAPLAIVDERHGPRGGGDAAVIGDVAGKVALVVDDMIDSGVTVSRAAEVLRAHGARSVLAYATHALLPPPAVQRLQAAALDEVIVTNSIAVPPERSFPGLTVLSVACLLGGRLGACGFWGWGCVQECCWVAPPPAVAAASGDPGHSPLPRPARWTLAFKTEYAPLQPPSSFR